MAVKYEEIDILGEGIEYTEPTKGNFVLNMLRRQGAWEVRQGFGQVAEFDTLMPFNLGGYTAGDTTEWGYKKHLGSHIIKTDFGHTQIVSIFRATIYTDEAGEVTTPPTPVAAPTYGAQIVDIFLVNIYDATTRERWEEPIYGHTSENGIADTDIEARAGNYESNLQQDMQSWVGAQGDDPFFFAEIGDTVYFGSRSVPMYAYSPATFRGNRYRQVATFRDGTHGDGGAGGATARAEWNRPYSESSLVWRVRPSKGQYPETFNYRTDSSLPQPEAMIAFDGALVIANERVLYFSNIFAPTVFIDQNIVVVPTEKEITALGRSGQIIYIFTESETWAYSPGSSDLLGEGMAPVRISDSIGCVSQNGTANFGEALIWVSLYGVHVASGGFDIKTISRAISPLFTDFITDPCTTFFTATTADTGSSAIYPARNSVVTFDKNMLNVTYCDHLRALLVTLPGQRATLCYTEDQWSLWTFESNTVEVSTPYGKVPSVEQNIMSPWLLSMDENLYCVGSVGVESYFDNATTKGLVWGDTTKASSFYVLEYGRGGALDRSVDDEDYRRVSAKYRIDWTNTTGGIGSVTARSVIIFDEWVRVDHGYKFWGTPSFGVTIPAGEAAPAAPEETYLIPVKIVPAHADYDLINGDDRGVEQILIKFFFDNTHWQPIFMDDSSSTTLDLVVPPERMASISSWVTRTCKDIGAPGNPLSRDGNYIELEWNGTAGGVWPGIGDHQPVAAASGGMNIAPYRENIICYIPMKTRSNISFPAGVSTMGLRIAGLSGNGWAEVFNNQAVPASHDFGAYIYQQWARFPRHREDVQGTSGTDPIAQPVDWAYMGPDVALNSDTRIKLRGLAVTLLSHGQGTDTVNSWTQGIFNTLFAADLKTWMAQVVDYIGGTAIFRRPVSVKTNLYPTPRTEQTIRDRIPGASPGQRAEFSAGVEWASSSVTSYETDTYVVGDEQVDTIVTSDSVKGTSVSAMIFGFMRNPAERLKIQSVKAMFRAVGANRRRKGR